MTAPAVEEPAVAAPCGAAAIPGRVLLRMAEAVVPHAAEEAYSPGLMAVQWEIRGGALWLAATDTRTLAAARCPASIGSADGGPVLLPASATMRLARTAASAGAALTLVRVDAQALAVTVQAGNGQLRDAQWPLPPARHEAADWRQVLGGLLAGPPEQASALTAESWLLSRFRVRSALADQVSGGWPARLRLEPRTHAGTGVRAWVVRCEDWFIGAILTGGPSRGPAAAGDGQWTQWISDGTSTEEEAS